MNNNEAKCGFFTKIISDKKTRYIVIGIICALIVAILLFNLLSVSTTKDIEENEINSYVLTLENKLSKSLSSVKGAGKVSVILSVEYGIKTILATENESQVKNGTETITETPLVVNGKIVPIGEELPKICGALIVAEGADNIFVLSQLQNAAASFLNIGTQNIKILTMK